jgi:hypothetical protein
MSKTGIQLTGLCDLHFSFWSLRFVTAWRGCCCDMKSSIEGVWYSHFTVSYNVVLLYCDMESDQTSTSVTLSRTT